MNTLKTLPITYKGELHDVKLINFSVDKEEVECLLPAPLKLRLINGRALISMVDVKLRNMHPASLPAGLHFNYRHIAFRLLLDDSAYSGDLKGIFFLRSFTSNPLIAFGGSIISSYNLSRAAIEESATGLDLKQRDRHLHYKLSPTNVIAKNDWMKQVVGNIDRAYSLCGEEVYVVQIQREKWPLQSVHCEEFGTNFFKSARFECAFKVNEVIPYTWMPPVQCHHPIDGDTPNERLAS